MLLSSIVLALASATVSASSAQDLESRQILNSDYRPQKGSCPSTPLLRSSGTLNPDEAAWVAQRKPIATAALKSWLAKTPGGFPVLSNEDDYPTMGFVAGGGGLRGFLISAGFHKAMDINEAEQLPTSGLYQSFVYETGLSGSALNMGTFGYQNWPTASSLIPSWQAAFIDLTKPNGGKLMTKVSISNEVRTKQFGGFSTTIVDTWARLVSWASLYGPNGGIATKLSDLTSVPGYTSFQNPMPIMTCLGIEEIRDGCGLPPKNATQYEFTPYEFGSWDSRVANFIQAKYMGTTLNAGRTTGSCVTGFDNLGWVMGTSANTFNEDCGGTENGINDLISPESFQTIKGIFTGLLANTNKNNFAIMPNPFYRLPSAPLIQNMPELYLVDGGQTIQVPPIWPYLYRDDVDVLIISDNSADGPANYKANGSRVNFPSGQQIFNTYTQAKNNGIEGRMPYIPPPSTFMANNGNKKSMTFFGCNLAATSPAMTFIYLPNRAVTFDSNQPAPRLQYDPATTLAMINNGIAIATNDGDPEFATCMGCAIMKKAAAKSRTPLPAECTACFNKYCWGYPNYRI